MTFHPHHLLQTEPPCLLCALCCIQNGQFQRYDKIIADHSSPKSLITPESILSATRVLACDLCYSVDLFSKCQRIFLFSNTELAAATQVATAGVYKRTWTNLCSPISLNCTTNLLDRTTHGPEIMSRFSCSTCKPKTQMALQATWSTKMS